MDEALGDRLSAVLESAEIRSLTRLSGGASRETWRFEADGVPLILQRQRAGDEREIAVEIAAIRAGAAAGVPVPSIVTASVDDDQLGAPYMILQHVDGETTPRKILRDEQFAQARDLLPGQLASALVGIHSIDPAAIPGIADVDQVERYREVLDTVGEPHPAFELAFKWLADDRPPPSERAVVHGDFRLGNVIVAHDGLQAVLDWELVHLGDPMEDLGWLCVKAWRFGHRQPVAGLAEYERLFDAYEAAGGAPVDADVVRWWEVLGTLKWGIMCIMQANAHLTGIARSNELEAIGRRVCENEYDLFLALRDRW